MQLDCAKLYQQSCRSAYLFLKEAERLETPLAQNPVQEFQLPFLAQQVAGPDTSPVYDMGAMQDCHLQIVPPSSITSQPALPKRQLAPLPPRPRKQRVAKATMYSASMARLQSVQPTQHRLPSPSPTVYSVRQFVESPSATRSMPPPAAPSDDQTERQVTEIGSGIDAPPVHVPPPGFDFSLYDIDQYKSNG